MTGLEGMTVTAAMPHRIRPYKSDITCGPQVRKDLRAFNFLLLEILRTAAALRISAAGSRFPFYLSKIEHYWGAGRINALVDKSDISICRLWIRERFRAFKPLRHRTSLQM